MPKQVPVEVLDSFDAKMEEIKEFMLRQDVYSAVRRVSELEEEAYDLFARLGSFPRWVMNIDRASERETPKRSWISNGSNESRRAWVRTNCSKYRSKTTTSSISTPNLVY
jgi:hypothetical protein